MTKEDVINVLYDLSENTLVLSSKGNTNVSFVDMKYVEKYVRQIEEADK